MRTPTLVSLLVCWIVTGVLGDEGANPGDILWSFQTLGKVTAPAAMDRDGRVYFGTWDASDTTTESTLYCLDSDGNEVWSKTFPNWLLAAPALTDTRVYVGCNDGGLYCLDRSNGEELWAFATLDRVDSTPCVDTLGNVYFGSRDRFFRAVSPERELLWSSFIGPVASSPILDEARRAIFVADLTNTIYRFDLAGNEVWSYKPLLGSIDGLKLRIFSSPALDGMDYLYVGSGDHRLHAIDSETGRLFWRRDTGSIVDSSPVIALDDFLYVANRAGLLHKFDITPSNPTRLVWTKDVGQVFYSAPAIDLENHIYICGAPVRLDPDDPPITQLSYIDHETSEILWKTDLPGYTDAIPLLDHQGDVYLGTADNQFFKIKGGGHALADTQWPTFHGVPAAHGRFENTVTRWLRENQLPEQLDDPERDSDGDGRSDFTEFATGSDPTDILSYDDRAPEFTITQSIPSQFRFSLQRGIRTPFVIEYTDNLSEWIPLLLEPSDLAFQEMGDRWEVTASLPSLPPIKQQLFRTRWSRYPEPLSNAKPD